MIAQARIDIEEQEEKLSVVYHAVEKGLHCVGATGNGHMIQLGEKVAEAVVAENVVVQNMSEFPTHLKVSRTYYKRE